MAAVTEQTDPYAGWKAELAGKPRGLAKGEVSSGFWSFKARGGTRTPLATWKDDADGAMVYSIDGGDPEECDEDFCELVFAKARAETQGAYDKRMETGQWPSEVKVPEAPVRPSAASPEPLPQNLENPHADQRNSLPDPHELILDQIGELKRDQQKWLDSIGGQVSTEEHYAKVISFRDTFLKLAQDADKARAEEKKPHLDAGRAVDARWKPVTTAAEDAKKATEKLPQAYLREKQRLEAEARAAAQAAAAAEAAAQERKPSREKSVSAAPQGGRGIKIEEPDKVVIDDWKAAILHFAKDTRFHENALVRQVVTGFAGVHLRRGDPVPGARLVHLDEQT